MSASGERAPGRRAAHGRARRGSGAAARAGERDRWISGTCHRRRCRGATGAERGEVAPDDLGSCLDRDVRLGPRSRRSRGGRDGGLEVVEDVRSQGRPPRAASLDPSEPCSRSRRGRMRDPAVVTGPLDDERPHRRRASFAASTPTGKSASRDQPVVAPRRGGSPDHRRLTIEAAMSSPPRAVASAGYAPTSACIPRRGADRAGGARSLSRLL